MVSTRKQTSLMLQSTKTRVIKQPPWMSIRTTTSQGLLLGLNLAPMPSAEVNQASSGKSQPLKEGQLRSRLRSQSCSNLTLMSKKTNSHRTNALMI